MQSDKREEKNDIIVAIACPLAFVALLWVIYFVGNAGEFDMALLGIHPLDVKSLTGILTSPRLSTWILSIFRAIPYRFS